VNRGKKIKQFILNENQTFQICPSLVNGKNNPATWYVVDIPDGGQENVIPLWLFGFLY
jgi:hypothetical protein